MLVDFFSLWYKPFNWDWYHKTIFLLKQMQYPWATPDLTAAIYLPSTKSWLPCHNTTAISLCSLHSGQLPHWVLGTPFHWMTVRVDGFSNEPNQSRVTGSWGHLEKLDNFSQHPWEESLHSWWSGPFSSFVESNKSPPFAERSKKEQKSNYTNNETSSLPRKLNLMAKLPN